MNTQTLHKTNYKNSSLGLIPVDWEVKKLGDLGEIVSGLTYSPEDINDNGILVLRSSNVQERQLEFNDNVYVKIINDKFNPVKENDILICVRNGSKSLIGKNAIITKEVEGVAFGAFMTVFRSDFNKYLYQLFDTDYFNNEIHKNLGATINSINGSDLKLFKFPFPLLPEQTAITNCLSTWDKAIALQTQLIEQKELRKKALMQQLLSGYKRLKGFSDDWKEVRLGEVCDLVNGMAFKPSDWVNSGIPIIRIQNLNGSTDFNYFDGEIQKRYLVNNGDLLFAWSGSRGTSFGAFRWFKEKAVLNQHIFNIFPKNGFEKDFAFQLLRWLTIEIERKAHGSAGLVHVTKKQLEDERMRIPHNKDEQIAIAIVLQCSDKELQLLKNKLQFFKDQKKGLMQLLLTGAKRLIK